MAAKKNRPRKNAGKGSHSHHAGYKTRKRANSRRRGGMRQNTGRRPRYRRNAGTFSGSGIGSIVTNAVFVIAGALGSKLLTQMVLGANNVGLIGYAGNAIVGGLMLSQVLTLYTTPVVYLYVERARLWVGSLRSRLTRQPARPAHAPA